MLVMRINSLVSPLSCDLKLINGKSLNKCKNKKPPTQNGLRAKDFFENFKMFEYWSFSFLRFLTKGFSNFIALVCVLKISRSSIVYGNSVIRNLAFKTPVPKLSRSLVRII
jgi:hypothetical protein